jgi:hypothetical protein
MKTTKESDVKSEACDDINRTAVAQDSDEPSGYITDTVCHERLNIRLLENIFKQQAPFQAEAVPMLHQPITAP